MLSEIQKKFGMSLFSIRELDNEKRSRMGVQECKEHRKSTVRRNLRRKKLIAELLKAGKPKKTKKKKTGAGDKGEEEEDDK